MLVGQIAPLAASLSRGQRGGGLRGAAHVHALDRLTLLKSANDLRTPVRQKRTLLFRVLESQDTTHFTSHLNIVINISIINN